MLRNNSIKKFVIFGILTEIIYLLFYFVEPLRKYLGDTAITLSYTYLFFAIIILLSLALAIYILAFKQVVKNNVNFKTIFIFFVIFNLTLLFVWPIGSIDVFSYIGWSRVLSEYHINPYSMAYSAFSNDAFYQIINNKWLSAPTPYGPLFVIISSVLTFLGGGCLLCNLFLFKLFFIIINILNGLIIYKTFKNSAAVFLYAWNPLILYEFSINAHSDILTIFFLLLGLYFLLNKQGKLTNHLLAWTFLMLSVLIKYITLILLPIIFLIILLKTKSRKEKLLFFLYAFAISIIIFFIFFFPFLKNANIFSTLISYLSYTSQGIAAVKTAIYPPALTAIFSSFLSYNLSAIITKIIFFIFYFLMVLYLIIKRNKLINKDIIKYSCLTLAVFLATFFSWVLPWYYALLICLLIYCSALDKYKYNNFIYGITFLSILYYLILR